VCERVCGRIELWVPEGARPDGCKSASLFEHAGEPLLYDVAVAPRAAVLTDGQRPGRSVIDREELLASRRATRRPAPSAPERLPHAVEHCWLFAYLSGKDARRRDVPTLLSVQQTRLHARPEARRARHLEGEWGWWPRDLGRPPAEAQAALLRCFPAPEVPALREARGEEVQRFGAALMPGRPAPAGAAPTPTAWSATSSATSAR
jgi:hypothetical protein